MEHGLSVDEKNENSRAPFDTQSGTMVLNQRLLNSRQAMNPCASLNSTQP